MATFRAGSFSHASNLKARINSRKTCVVASAATTLPSQFKGVTPIADRVLVKVDKEEAKTSGGVYLPTTAQLKPTVGSIIAAGEGATSAKTGDRVLYSKFAGVEITMAGGEHVLLKEEDVVGIMPSSDNVSQLSPLGDRLVVKIADAETKTSAGLLLSVDQNKPNIGTVVAVGSGTKKEGSDEIVKPKISKGDTVMYSKYSGMELEDDNGSYIIIRESDVLAALA